jgi:hypothetical protein
MVVLGLWLLSWVMAAAALLFAFYWTVRLAVRHALADDRGRQFR